MPPSFEVWFTPLGRVDYNALRADLRAEVDAAVQELERHGCAAAGYRLSGVESELGRICVVHLARDWRLILGFPASDEVAVLSIGRHLRNARSVYEQLYRLVGVTSPTDERTQPPCCEDDEPPVDQQLVDDLVAAAKQMRRRRS